MGHPARTIFENAVQRVPSTPQDVVILLSDGGATLADCSAITQPLMEANRLAGGRQLYRWRYASLTEPVQRLACGGGCWPAPRRSASCTAIRWCF